ncbi:MAG TPA: zinc-binding dehydrogenase [Dictyobacter sp.]|jgi:NADPH:quinone reductase-like Zn-dependent oxidoreductase|nr:zinc-binding dehydrogenase [Dictyobacter sp.]
MKTVQFSQFGEPEVLQVQEAPDPVAGQQDVLVEVKATTVNRLDLFQRAGSRPVNLPFTPGLEAAGIVLADSNGFSAGEHVLTSHATAAKGGGGYASKIAVPAQSLARIPAELSFEQAAAAGLAASTAWGSLFDLGHLQAGERVLIWAGSSGVGTIAIQMAKQAGAWIATTASSPERIETLKKLGADLVINHRQQDVSQLLQEQGGVDLVIEMVGSTLQTSIQACASKGRVVLVGNLGGQQATVDTQAWRMKLVQVIGGGQIHTSTANEEKFLRMIAEKRITPIIGKTLPVEQAAEAHRLLDAGDIQGKIVLLHS